MKRKKVTVVILLFVIYSVSIYLSANILKFNKIYKLNTNSIIVASSNLNKPKPIIINDNLNNENEDENLEDNPEEEKTDDIKPEDKENINSSIPSNSINNNISNNNKPNNNVSNNNTLNNSSSNNTNLNTNNTNNNKNPDVSNVINNGSQNSSPVVDNPVTPVPSTEKTNDVSFTYNKHESEESNITVHQNGNNIEYSGSMKAQEPYHGFTNYIRIKVTSVDDFQEDEVQDASVIVQGKGIATSDLSNLVQVDSSTNKAYVEFGYTFQPINDGNADDNGNPLNYDDFTVSVDWGNGVANVYNIVLKIESYN